MGLAFLTLLSCLFPIWISPDKQSVNHEGSKRFREVIEQFIHRYQKAVTKYEKMNLTKEIYDTIKVNSRFLKYNEETPCWEEVTSMAARDKVRIIE